MSSAVAVPSMPGPELDLAEIQGVVLRSYRMPFLRALALQVQDATRVRNFLKQLADGDGSSMLRIQNAEVWQTRPKSCLNIAVTAEGLRAIGMPEAVLATFPPEFVEGAVARAAMVGDTGANAPSQWMKPFADPSGVHIVLFLSADSREILAQLNDEITKALGSAASCVVLPDGVMPADHRAHFGYVDGISQPRVAGVPKQGADVPGIPEFSDPMALVPPGAFVLGYPSQHPDYTYPMPSPDTLGRNGSFAAVRVLAQDCAAFENYLTEMAEATGFDRELVAAKLCGRWRTGVPLALSDNPDPASVPMEKWNEFDYADDPAGKKCPLGAHIRRNNPRATSVAGDGGEKHRIMRRGLPYGPPFDPENPNDGIERGLLGFFICGNLRDQFEFLMKEWINDGDFVGLGPDRDPILGNQPPEGGRFRCPAGKGQPPVKMRNMPSFVTTRGGAYCFLPGRSALRYLSGL
jgi:Dyp-type peroxidase family